MPDATPADRFRRATATFEDIATSVEVAGAWDRPAPCDGWSARDVVAHLTAWVPAVLARAGLEVPSGDPADPLRSWTALARSLQAALDDPTTAATEFDAGPPGTMRVDSAIDMLVTGDVLVHTWDLAAAAGLDVALDPEMCEEMLAGMEAMDAALRASGHFGPRVDVADGATVQERLIAFTGRDPAWRSPA